MALLDLDPIKASIKANLFWVKVGLVVLVLVATFFAGWWVNGWRWEGKENRANKEILAQVEKERKSWLEEKQRIEQANLITADHLSNLETQKDTLLATLQGLKLTRTIKVEPNVQGECESAVLGDDFRLRWNSVVETAAAYSSSDSGD